MQNDSYGGIPVTTDSFGGQLAEDGLPKPNRRTLASIANDTVSEVSRMLGSWGLPDPIRLMKGEWAELSPKQMDHLLRGYFSWAGATAATVADTVARPALDRGDRPESRLKDMFIVGNFAESLTDRLVCKGR